MAKLGFNRISFGVQDFNTKVLQAVNPLQSQEHTLDMIQQARETGFVSINADLIYGLPYQTPETFAQTLDTLMGARPNRVAVYNYAHLPRLFKA